VSVAGDAGDAGDADDAGDASVMYVCAMLQAVQPLPILERGEGVGR
jgi:hypothetical protein